MTKLSVVVPIYNVEAYLHEALASVAAQTMSDLEVIMVDDGSTDSSSAIAKSIAAADPRFRLLQQENQGQGPARNLGVQHATGEYLAFLDGDDLVPRDAYEVLVGSLDETGSDIAGGNVRRFGSGWISPTVSHEDAYRKTLLQTTLSRHPVLLRDGTVWNKVYRRSFWQSSQLGFWAARYEDIPVCTRAYALARSIDIHRKVVYYWRARESGQLSRQQKAREADNVADRMAACLEAGRILAQHAPSLKPALDHRVLVNDLAILLSTVEFCGDSDRARLLDLAAGYLGTVDDSVLRTVAAFTRLQYHLIRAGMRDELLEVMRYAQRDEPATARLVSLGRARPKWYIEYPYFTDPSRRVPLAIYDASQDTKLHVHLDAAGWQAGRLRIEGFAYIDLLDAPREQDTKLEVLLRNPVLKRTIKLKTDRIKRPDVTAQSGHAAACYDWSGFAVHLDPARLSNLGTWRAATWELRVRVTGPGIRREGPVDSVLPGPARWPEASWVTDGIRLQPSPEHDGGFVIRAERPGAVVTSCQAEGDQLHIEGWSRVPLGREPTVVLALQQGGGKSTRIPGIATDAGLGRTGFRAAIDVSQLLSAVGRRRPADREHEPTPGSAGPAVAVADEIHWDLSVVTGAGRKIRLAGEPGAAGHRVAAGGDELSTYLTAFGNVSAVQRHCRLIIRQASWKPDGRLILSGDFPATEAAPQLMLLRSVGSGYQHSVPFRWQGSTFMAELAPGAMPGLAGSAPLTEGRWELLARTAAGETRLVADRALLVRLPGSRQVGAQSVRLEPYRGDALQIMVRNASPDSGAYAQRKLRNWYASSKGDRPLEDVVVFDSYAGEQYSCNPRAIYEELRRRSAGLDCAWISRAGQFTPPDGARVVALDSREHYELAARARFLVSNTLQQPWYRGRPGQIYLQTWHGTPLKRIGLDLERPQFTGGMLYHDRVREDVASWSALVSASAYSTAAFRGAFGFGGEVLQVGYPRNDLLARPGTDRAAAIRQQLGLRADQQVILYAPTWRDDAPTRAAGFGFPQNLDFTALSRALGGDYVTLVRAHYLTTETLLANPSSQVVDVTAYPDMADLLLVADVLITDYSSAMFDFAITGRPMLFFTYDLERYRDKIRGFYLDYEAEAPGPLLRTTDDLISALRSVSEVSRSYQASYHRFAAKFCSLEDGQAAAGATDWLLRHLA